jgi:GNAT superfamily N-acetyltransferase
LGGERLGRLEPAEWAEMWGRRLSGPGATLVAEADGRVVGFVSVGASRDEEAPEVGEVYALYVAPLHWGTGPGVALLAAAAERLREQAFAEAILWTLRGNSRSCRFYEREGWVADGANKPITLLDRQVEVVRYRRAL